VLIPILYLKGVSTGDFDEALIALLCNDAGGLSATTVGRLKEAWSEEYARWSKRDLSAKRYVYFWADGFHVQARLEDAAQCLLVIIGATREGKKELVDLIDGVRESAQSWKELLLDLKRRGLAVAPELAVADGALGFWHAIEEVWAQTHGQRCWVHKTANVLNKLPKSQQSKPSARCRRSGWRKPRRMRRGHGKRDRAAQTKCAADPAMPNPVGRPKVRHEFFSPQPTERRHVAGGSVCSSSNVFEGMLLYGILLQGTHRKISGKRSHRPSSR
jgi:hypothetical protein